MARRLSPQSFMSPTRRCPEAMKMSSLLPRGGQFSASSTTFCPGAATDLFLISNWEFRSSEDGWRNPGFAPHRCIVRAFAMLDLIPELQRGRMSGLLRAPPPAGGQGMSAATDTNTRAVEMRACVCGRAHPLAAQSAAPAALIERPVSEEAVRDKAINSARLRNFVTSRQKRQAPSTTETSRTCSPTEIVPTSGASSAIFGTEATE
jgi:hypothetical protein